MISSVAMMWAIAGPELALILGNKPDDLEELQRNILTILEKTGLTWPKVSLNIGLGIALSNTKGAN